MFYHLMRSSYIYIYIYMKTALVVKHSGMFFAFYCIKVSFNLCFTVSYIYMCAIICVMYEGFHILEYLFFILI